MSWTKRRLNRSQPAIRLPGQLALRRRRPREIRALCDVVADVWSWRGFPAHRPPLPPLQCDLLRDPVLLPPVPRHPPNKLPRRATDLVYHRSDRRYLFPCHGGCAGLLIASSRSLLLAIPTFERAHSLRSAALLSFRALTRFCLVRWHGFVFSTAHLVSFSRVLLSSCRNVHAEISRRNFHAEIFAGQESPVPINAM